MSSAFDRRLTPVNDRVAATSFAGLVDAAHFSEGTHGRLAEPVVDLLRAPGGARDRQLLLGEGVTAYEHHDGWAFVQADKDGYVGYIASAALRDADKTTHRVAVPATHLYPAPNMKTKESHWVSFGSELRVVSASGEFFELDTGHFVPKPHLRPLNAPFADAVTVAQMHFGVPYLWGGNSSAGIDCSGLVQAAVRASGRDCPGDSDLQEAALGKALPAEAPVQRGDLFFWKGHVAMAVDEVTIIHANAHHMAVAYEPLSDAKARIKAAGDGPVTSHKRL